MQNLTSPAHLICLECCDTVSVRDISIVTSHVPTVHRPVGSRQVYLMFEKVERLSDQQRKPHSRFVLRRSAANPLTV
jgi:hypothetical protein